MEAGELPIPHHRKYRKPSLQLDIPAALGGIWLGWDYQALEVGFPSGIRLGKVSENTFMTTDQATSTGPVGPIE